MKKMAELIEIHVPKGSYTISREKWNNFLNAMQIIKETFDVDVIARGAGFHAETRPNAIPVGEEKMKTADDLLEEWIKTYDETGCDRFHDGTWSYIDPSFDIWMYGKNFQEWLDEHGYKIIVEKNQNGR